jgi:hypothetical protein
VDLKAAEARLADLDGELARLREQYDLAMSAFKFDEAKQLHEQIAAAEAEYTGLVKISPRLLPAQAEPKVIHGPSSRRGRRLRRASLHRTL